MTIVVTGELWVKFRVLLMYQVLYRHLKQKHFGNNCIQDFHQKFKFMGKGYPNSYVQVTFLLKKDSENVRQGGPS